MTIKLYHDDCFNVFPTLEDESIDLTVTSPPYDNLRTYNDSLVWGESVWKNVLSDLYRVTKVGGVVVWIVGDATIRGSETGTSFKQALHAMECGFNLHDTMIWNKGGFSAVGALKVRYAPVFEYMFVLVRGNLETFNPIKDRINKCYGHRLQGTIRQPDGSTVPLRGVGEKFINKFGQRHNIWDKFPVKSNKHNHPAPFPVALVEDHVISWSNEGDVVLDPFMGSGTTGVACRSLNRSFIGIEKEENYFNIAKERIGE